MFTKTSFAMKCFFFGHTKCTFVNSAMKILLETWENTAQKTEEDIEKNILFSKKTLVMKTLLWTCKGSSENRAEKLSAKNQNPETLKKNSLEDIF